jgi:hypothetical protein
MDMFEADNIVELASSYLARQYHTFNESNDVDWVKFTVAQSAIDRNLLYQIETQNLGWSMDTVLYLYAPDGSTVLDRNDDYGNRYASRIRWRPQQPGVYFLKVVPYSSNSTGHCDASYELSILPIFGQVFLPRLDR